MQNNVWVLQSVKAKWRDGRLILYGSQSIPNQVKYAPIDQQRTRIGQDKNVRWSRGEAKLVLQQQKAQDAEQRDLAWHAANTIYAYGWSKDGNEAEMFKVQNGFTYPQLWMTASIPSALCLTAGEDSSSMLQYYNTARIRWGNIIQGHAITLDTPISLHSTGADTKNDITAYPVMPMHYMKAFKDGTGISLLTSCSWSSNGASE
ncbi:uncharacterized protein F5891DRAFT_978934 [Suillus fuscotomentosus]|uniref:Uncharacterized protein n=1 Tax=Suillus fuscotomentosus TaxID=1912939 RepID=A0AAD4HMU1_9AGAM|nr:uncharacterized protein F5891DRAFT_978934 [Suillus fuscotomentosus]KAG1902232.1 hypothetical protein F5891DRAFT_978934 [Suillus fuscotomentosus]